MIQKNTYVYPVDKSGALLCNVFHTYRGGHKLISKIGEFVKISIRKAKPDIKLKKKSKSRALIVRTSYRSFRKDGSYGLFYENSIILIKRKLITRSKEFTAVTDKNIKRKKLLYKFLGVL